MLAHALPQLSPQLVLQVASPLSTCTITRVVTDGISRKPLHNFTQIVIKGLGLVPYVRVIMPQPLYVFYLCAQHSA